MDRKATKVREKRGEMGSNGRARERKVNEAIVRHLLHRCFCRQGAEWLWFQTHHGCWWPTFTRFQKHTLPHTTNVHKANANKQNTHLLKCIHCEARYLQLCILSEWFFFFWFVFFPSVMIQERKETFDFRNSIFSNNIFSVVMFVFCVMINQFRGFHSSQGTCMESWAPAICCATGVALIFNHDHLRLLESTEKCHSNFQFS